jgi:hypothetical protein
VASDERLAKKGRLKIGVSTKVEEAWYVHPELLGGRGDEPSKVVIDADKPALPDATVTLGETDIQPAEGGLESSDEDARHYRDVSLRGALLAPSDDTDGGDAPLAPERAASSKNPSRPPPPPVEQRAFAPTEAPRTAPEHRRPARGFDLGSIPPIWIAAVAFALGVGMTLIGVLLAL